METAITVDLITAGILGQVDAGTRGMAGSSLEYTNQTVLHPIGLLATLVLGCAMIVAPRRWAIVPMVILACFIAPAQRISILGLDFGLLRIMVLFGVARLLLRNEVNVFKWKPLDTAIVLWTFSSVCVYTLQQGSVSAFVNRLGFGFDAIGMYFVFTCLIRDWLDVDRIILGCIWISIPVAVFFLVENSTGRNLFSIFGGVPAITLVREGRLRCQGAFAHPILAGCFWATLFPLFVARWWKMGRHKAWAIVGVFTTIILVLTCASSTPVMGLFAATIGGGFFFFRRSMRSVRWGVFLGIIALHLVMRAPVWHLIARVSAVGGSTSYHRFNLINAAIKRFGEWFLFGTRSTIHWGWGLQDVTNQYVLEGVRGGLLTLILFMAVIVIAFREVGLLWRSQVRHPYRLALSWALGVSLFVHCMNFIGVSYFGQIWVVWYLLLAMIGSMSVHVRSNSLMRMPVASAIDPNGCFRGQSIARSRF